MGYAVYEDRDARDHGVTRWAGYGVPAACDQPGCEAQINRGLAYKCEAGHAREDDAVYAVDLDDDGRVVASRLISAPDIEFGDYGCGLYFCEEHRYEINGHDGVKPKPEIAEWERHMLTHESWAQWRDEHPEETAAIQARADAGQR